MDFLSSRLFSILDQINQCDEWLSLGLQKVSIKWQFVVKFLFKLSHQTFKCVYLNFLTPFCIVKGVFNNGQSSQTVGSLDMGGASAQKVNSCRQKQEGHLFITSNSLELLGWKPFWSSILFSRNKYVLLIHLDIIVETIG